MAKCIKTEISFEKRDNDVFVVTQNQVDEFNKTEMEKFVKAQLLQQKATIDGELKANEEHKMLLAEIADKPELKKFLADRFQIREFSDDEIEVKNTQLKLLNEKMAEIDKVVGATEAK